MSEPKYTWGHSIVDLNEFDRIIDVDYPTLRETFGGDLKQYRPLAIKTAGPLLTDYDLTAKHKGFRDLCDAVANQTFATVTGNPKLMDILDMDKEHVRLLCTYVGVLVVYLAKQIEPSLKHLMGGHDVSNQEVVTSPSSVIQASGNAIAMEVGHRFLTPPQLSADNNHASTPPASTTPPWKSENSW